MYKNPLNRLRDALVATEEEIATEEGRAVHASTAWMYVETRRFLEESYAIANAAARRDTTASDRKTRKRPTTKIDEPKRKRSKKGSTKDVFRGCHVLFVNYGSSVSKARIGVWSRNVKRLGGVAYDRPSAETTHVVLCPQIYDVSKLTSIFGEQNVQLARSAKRTTAEVCKGIIRRWKLPTNVHFVTTDWIVRSLRRKQLECTSRYRWECVRSSLASPTKSVASTDGTIDVSAAPPVMTRNTSLQRRRQRQKKSFMCQRGGPNVNEHITSVLDTMSTVYKIRQDTWRSLSYARASSSVKTLACRLTNVSTFRRRLSSKNACDRISLPRVGKGMIDHIIEIIETGTMRKLSEALSEPRICALMAFSKIWGVGVSSAERLWRSGARSIEHLRAIVSKETTHDEDNPRASAEVKDDNTGDHAWRHVWRRRGLVRTESGEMRQPLLSSRQMIGLKHYEDFQSRIPRAEIAALAKVVRGVANELLPGTEAVVTGSYRRGKSSSGDMDILLSHPPSGDCSIMKALIARLSEIGFLTDHLAMPSDHEKGKSDSYMGVCRLQLTHGVDDERVVSGKHRRIDIKAYPMEQMPFAMLYFTGSDHFNRSMRLWAKRMCKMTLSDKHLAYATRNARGQKVCVGTRVSCKTERDVFEALELDYREPTDRNCYDVAGTIPAWAQEEEDEAGNDDFSYDSLSN